VFNSAIAEPTIIVVEASHSHHFRPSLATGELDLSVVPHMCANDSVRTDRFTHVGNLRFHTANPFGHKRAGCVVRVCDHRHACITDWPATVELGWRHFSTVKFELMLPHVFAPPQLRVLSFRFISCKPLAISIPVI
jgi:hypothetical protein